MNSCHNLNDSQLLDLLKVGEEAAFSEIYERYWGLLFSHVYKMTGDEDESKDIVQDIFTSLWAKAPTLQCDTNVGGYLYMCARNRVLNQIRHKRTHSEHLNSLASFSANENNHVLEQLNSRDLEQALQRGLERLPGKMREIFELSRKQHLSYKEIAFQLDISDKTVKKQISNALRILRLHLNSLICILFFLSMI